MKGFFQLISSTEFLDLFSSFSSLESETVKLSDGLARVIYRPYMEADEQVPPFSRSTMDGFAVRARDTFGCSETEPALLEIVGEIKMGHPGTDYSLEPSQTVRIWTGGELPTGGDGVVMVEYSRLLSENQVEIFRPVAPGENVIRAGEDFNFGDKVFTAGKKKLRPQDLGILAALGKSEIEVHKKVRVGIISTGDELVSPAQPLSPGKIRDINSTTLAALVQEAGAIPTCYGIIEDNLGRMLAVCEDALKENDVLLLSGGSSVGKKDFTYQVLQHIEGSELLAHGVSIRPGKPTLLAKRGNQAIFGLPGHVASAMVVFYLFVRPLLNKLSGLEAETGLLETVATVSQPIPSVIGREEYLRVKLGRDKGAELPVATPVYGKSGLLRPLIEADGLLVIDRDVEGLASGSMARVLLFP